MGGYSGKCPICGKWFLDRAALSAHVKSHKGKIMARLSHAEVERLTLIAEEAAEVVQAATKVLRHGWLSEHPACPGVNNRKHLIKELGDLRACIQLCFQANDMNSVDYQFYALDKLHRVQKYLHCGENVVLAEEALDQHNSPVGS